jgi:glucose-1-phosphatase
VIRAIIFDVGGVLIRTQDPAPRRGLERHLGLAAGESEELVFGEPMGIRAQRGEITADALWAWIQQEMELDSDGITAFFEQFYGGDRLDLDLVDTVRTLRGPYQTAIISNAMDNLLEMVTYLYPMRDAFDLVVGSAYEGIMKPDRRIYARTLERLGRAPHEAVFIDDMFANVEAARALGMAGIHYQAGLDVAAALRELGVAVEERATDEDTLGDDPAGDDPAARSE